MFNIWWSSVLAKVAHLRSASRKRSRCRRNSRLSTYHVWFEALEDRFAPSTTNLLSGVGVPGAPNTALLGQSNTSNVSQTVIQSSPGTTLSTSANPLVFGQDVTYTVTISPVSPGAGVPTGVVTFEDNGASMGTGALSSGEASFSTSSLTVAAHTITTVYGGDGNFAGNTSPPLLQTVNQASTTSAITATISNPVTPNGADGQSVTPPVSTSDSTSGTSTGTGTTPPAGTPATTTTADPTTPPQNSTANTGSNADSSAGSGSTTAPQDPTTPPEKGPTPAPTQDPTTPPANPPANPQAGATLQNLANLPLSFVANQGQYASSVGYVAQGPGFSLALDTNGTAVLALNTPSTTTTTPPNPSPISFTNPQAGAPALPTPAPPTLVSMQFVGANPNAQLMGLGETSEKTNYFIGDDPSQWATDVASYGQVEYHNLYPGIDVIYYGASQNNVEYNLVVSPGADLSAVKLSFTGAQSTSVDAQGNLVLHTAAGDVTQLAPAIYQQDSTGNRQLVAGHYSIAADGSVSFQVAAYDRSKPLVIDPELVYSSFVGVVVGTGTEFGTDVAVDATGHIYVTGVAYETTNNAYDAFVLELDPTGSHVLYATYLGGSDERACNSPGLALDASGNVYLAGYTSSTSFPTMHGLTVTPNGVADVFVSKLSADFTMLEYSTYLGGNGFDATGAAHLGIVLDATGNIYVTGSTSSTNFTLQNPYQSSLRGSEDAFVSEIDPVSYSLLYSTYLSGDNSSSSVGNGIALHDGHIYVTGVTGSSQTDFPYLFAHTSHVGPGGADDAFVTQLDPTAESDAQVLYSTLLGGTADDDGHAIAVDNSGNIYVGGDTASTTFDTFPLYRAFQSSWSGVLGTFITELNPTGTTLIYSSYLGGSNYDFLNDLAVDGFNNVYVIGSTESSDFPTANRLPGESFNGNQNVFISEVTDTGGSNVILSLSTPLRGSGYDYGYGMALGAPGVVYVTGRTSSPDFPTVNPFAPFNGSSDAFISEINTGPVSAQVRTWDPNSGDALLQTGDVQVEQDLQLDRSPTLADRSGYPTEALVYNSDSAAPQPIIQVQVNTEADEELMSPIPVQLTWDGMSLDTEYISTSGYEAGDTITLAVPVPVGSSLATGRHSWSMQVTLGYPDCPVDTVSGTYYVDNQANSPIAPGWTFAMTDQLVAIPADDTGPEGILFVHGSGGVGFFQRMGDTDTYQSPAGDNGTLTRVTEEDELTGYIYTEPDGTTLDFNAEGLQTDLKSADGNATSDNGGAVTTFTYTGGLLTGMTTPDGAVTTLSYSGGKLSHILTVGSRTTTLTDDGNGDLAQITNADGRIRTFMYQSHLLRQDTTGEVFNAYTYAYGAAASYVTGSTEPTIITPAATQGVGTAGPGDAPAVVTDPLGNTTTTVLDLAARPLQETDPDGGVTTWQRNADGYVTATTDPLMHTTSYTVDADGYVTEQMNPDSTTEIMYYQPAYQLGSPSNHHALTYMTDEDSHPSNYYYDDAGHLTSTTDATSATTTYAWDSKGEMISMTDPDHNTTTYAFDPTILGRQTAMIDALDDTTAYQYDSRGNLTVTIDANGNRTGALYDAVGRVIEQTTPVSTTYNHYDSAGLLDQTINALGTITDTIYNDRGLLIETDEAVGTDVERITTNGYDAASNLTQTIDPLGHITDYGYDTMDRQTSTAEGVETGLPRITSETYDVAGNETSSTDGDGNTTHYLYDSRNRQTEVIDPMSNATTTDYDGVGNIMWTRDPRGNYTYFGYDNDNRQTYSDDPLGNTKNTNYDPAGNVTSVYDAGQTTTYTFDALNRQIGVRDPMGVLTTTRYDDVGNVTETIQPVDSSTSDDLITRYGYDAGYRQTSVTEAANDSDLTRTTYTAYDAAGDATATTDAMTLTTENVFDALGRQIETIDPTRQTTQTLYDADDNVTETIDPDNDITDYAFDAFNEQTAVTVGADTSSAATTNTRYDSAGNTISVEDADDNITRYTYNADNEQTSETNPQGYTETWLYDPNGNATQSVDFDGRTIQSSYDGDNRLYYETWVSANVYFNYGYLYDTNLQTYASEYNNGNNYYENSSYNPDESVTQVSDYGSGAPNSYLTETYDAAQRPKAVSDNTGWSTTYQYDALSRLRLIDGSTMPGSGTYDHAEIALTYNPDDDLTGIDRTATGSLNDVATAQSFDADNRVTGITDTGLSVGSVFYGYAYDPAGQLATSTDKLNSTETDGRMYTYNSQGELTGVADTNTSDDESYTLDANGNRSGSNDGETYQAPATGNELTTIAVDGSHTYTYGYDPEGNLTQVVDLSTNRTETLSYDFRNRLTDVTVKNSEESIVYEEQYVYDANNKRIGDMIVTYVGGSTSTVWTTYNGDNVWGDFVNENYNPTYHYLYGPAVDMVMARIGQDADTAWYLTDHQGSVRILADNTGAELDTITYDSYGNPTDSTGGGDRFKYTGQQYDTGLALAFSPSSGQSEPGFRQYLDGVRYYNPETGTFESPDPAAADVNTYRYVGDGPTDGTDPSGLKWVFEKQTVTRYSPPAWDEWTRTGSSWGLDWSEQWGSMEIIPTDDGGSATVVNSYRHQYLFDPTGSSSYVAKMGWFRKYIIDQKTGNLRRLDTNGPVGPDTAGYDFATIKVTIRGENTRDVHITVSIATGVAVKKTIKEFANVELTGEVGDEKEGKVGAKLVFGSEVTVEGNAGITHRAAKDWDIRSEWKD